MTETAPDTRSLAPIVALASEAATLTGMLYYFGWVRTRATFDYFGLDTSALGFSASDYLLRSLNATIPMLVTAGIVVLALHAARHWLHLDGRLQVRARPVLRRAGWIAGPGLLAVVVAGLVAPSEIGRPLGVALPLTLLAASGALACVWSSTGATARPRAAALVMLALVGLLWTVALHADHKGRQYALAYAASLRDAPEIVVYTTERQAITGHGVHVEPIRQDDTRFHFRYTGLRLLIQTADKIALLPTSWRRGRDPVFLLHDTPDLRIDTIAR